MPSFTISLNIFAAIPLTIFAYAATFMRLYRGDEFFIHNGTLKVGILNETLYYYFNGNARFLAMLTLSSMVSLDIRLQAAIKIALMLAWWIGLLLIYHHFLTTWLTASLAASITMLVFFQALPSVPLTIYWQNGSMIYFVPIVIFTYLIWCFLTQKPTWVVFALAFIVGFYSEVFAIAEIIVFIGIYFTAIRLRRLWWCVLGAALALIGQLFAPGTWVRAGAYTHDLNAAFHEALSTAALPLLAITIRAFFPALALFFLLMEPSALSAYHQRQQRFKVASLLILSVCVSATAYAIPVYFSQQALPYYAWSIPLFFTIGVLVIAGRTLFSCRVPMILLVTAVLFAIVSGLNLAWGINQSMMQFSQAWDARDRELKAFAQPLANLCTTPIILPQSSPDVFPDPLTLDNVAMATYYGVASLRACP